jgi:pimeloyl-ACP methyl ester carboxylesterase
VCPKRREGEDVTTFVLVHGSWSGAHGFRWVRRGLQGAGHEVFTPSLTGIGERVHLVSPQVTLSTHIRDVVNQVLFEDLSGVVLVGCSYGGFPVTGALEHIADRVRHLVYLDAFVPRGRRHRSELGHGDRSDAGASRLRVARFTARAVDDLAEAMWATARRTPHPVGCFTEPVRLLQPLERFAFTRTYIKATLDPPTDLGASALVRAGQHAKRSPQWRCLEIESTPAPAQPTQGARGTAARIRMTAPICSLFAIACERSTSAAQAPADRGS